MVQDELEAEDLRIQRTKYVLREAIAKLLESKDLKDISIQQISKKAMIYRTTFYTHYSDKYDLLEDYLMETWKKEIKFESFKIDDQIKEQYWNGVHDTVKFFKRYSKLIIQLNENNSIISNQNLIYTTIKNYFILLLDIIQPNDSKANVSKERISEFYTAGYLNIIINWLLNDTKDTCELITQDCIKMTDENLKFLLNQSFS